MAQETRSSLRTNGDLRPEDAELRPRVAVLGDAAGPGQFADCMEAYGQLQWPAEDPDNGSVLWVTIGERDPEDGRRRAGERMADYTSVIFTTDYAAVQGNGAAFDWLHNLEWGHFRQLSVAVDGSSELDLARAAVQANPQAEVDQSTVRDQVQHHLQDHLEGRADFAHHGDEEMRALLDSVEVFLLNLADCCDLCAVAFGRGSQYQERVCQELLQGSQRGTRLVGQPLVTSALTELRCKLGPIVRRVWDQFWQQQ